MLVKCPVCSESIDVDGSESIITCPKCQSQIEVSMGAENIPPRPRPITFPNTVTSNKSASCFSFQEKMMISDACNNIRIIKNILIWFLIGSLISTVGVIVNIISLL